MHTVRFLLVGLGNLGRRFCQVLLEKDALLRQRYGLHLRLVGAADSQGAAYDLALGLDLEKVVTSSKRGAPSLTTPARGGGGGRPRNWSPRRRPICCWRLHRST
jgi:homoserine dehydrogenase